MKSLEREKRRLKSVLEGKTDGKPLFWHFLFLNSFSFVSAVFQFTCFGRWADGMRPALGERRGMARREKNQGPHIVLFCLSNGVVW